MVENEIIAPAETATANPSVIEMTETKSAVKDGGSDPPTPLWQTKIWGAVTVGLGITALLLIILVGYSIYSTTSIVETKSEADLAFTFSGLGLINTTLMRLLAMLIGAGIIFGGLAVSFFSSSDSNRVSLQAIPAAGETYKAMVASHTPGIIGIFIGGIIIIAALFATSTQEYQTPERWIINPAKTEFQSSKSGMRTADDILKETGSPPISGANGSIKHEAN
jgi:hypothetical protein